MGLSDAASKMGTKMSKISNLALIGQGESAEVYTWEDGQVLKLYRQQYPRQKMEHEAHVAQIIHKHGLGKLRV